MVHAAQAVTGVEIDHQSTADQCHEHSPGTPSKRGES
jgi:hypothetical protein